jgi:hypothetical protein
MKLLLLVAALLSAFPTFTSLAAESRYQYLVDTTNAIFEVKSQSMTLNKEQIGEIAARACRTLERLQHDEAFVADVNRLAEASKKNASYHEQLRHDLKQFVDSFLTPEEAILKQGGLSQDAINQLRQDETSFRDSLGSKADPRWLLSELGRLRTDICSAAQRIAAMQSQTPGQDHGPTATGQQDAENHKLLDKCALAIGGLTLIALDALSEAPSAGVATASFTLGGAIFSSVLPK